MVEGGTKRGQLYSGANTTSALVGLASVYYTLTTGSFTMSASVMMLGPPRKFSKIFISRLIFFFFTGWKGKEHRWNKAFQGIPTGNVIQKWLTYEPLIVKKCVRLNFKSHSPSPVPGTLQVLSKYWIEKVFISKTRPLQNQDLIPIISLYMLTFYNYTN